MRHGRHFCRLRGLLASLDAVRSAGQVVWTSLQMREAGWITHVCGLELLFLRTRRLTVTLIILHAQSGD